MQAWVSSQKGLNRPALMDGGMIPNQDDRALGGSEQMLEKGNHLFPSEAAAMDLNAKFDFASTGRNDQCADSVETVVMLQTGSDRRRLPTRGPRALERRDQTEATFVHKNQVRAKLAPLFLSKASDSDASGQSRPRRVGQRGVGVSGNSTLFAARGARPHWDDSGPQTRSKSDEQCAPASSSRRHSHGLERPGANASPDASIALQTNAEDVQDAFSLVGLWAVWLRLATVVRCGV